MDTVRAPSMSRCTVVLTYVRTLCQHTLHERIYLGNSIVVIYIYGVVGMQGPFEYL